MSAENPTTRPTVLVVDDDTTILLVLEQILQYLGVDALTAETGEAAVEIAAGREDGIDAVLLDFRLPGMGCGPTGEALQQLYPDCPIIISSGYKPAEIGGQQGQFRFLPKPYNTEDIARVLSEVGVTLDRQGDR